ncbi:MAG: hypothetical protein K1X78_02845 [Verrucomicrobiaceae bacterium]|nr:hypothetical protein [Verrucomicrobiaceae bacterium]
MKKQNTPIAVRAGSMEFLKVNDSPWDWRDLYHWVLSLSWPRFILAGLGNYLALNLVFATAYWLRADCISEMRPGSFSDAFFFSMETLATVGYGHMHPVTLYGHVVVSLEIMAGVFITAVITGVIFVRFSRPTARVIFSDKLVIAPFDGKPALAFRVANGRHQSMVEAHFCLMLHRDEMTAEGDDARRFYTLKLTFDRLILFPAALTLRHVIDESSPLFGVTREQLEASHSRFMASVTGVDTVIPAPMQSQHDYHWRDVRFGEQFVDIYSPGRDGRYTVDYGRLHETETVG